MNFFSNCIFSLGFVSVDYCQFLFRMHEEAIVITNLKDYLFHTSTLCALDEAPLMESFNEAEKKHIAYVRSREASMGKSVWYPLTQTILGHMVLRWVFYWESGFDSSFDSFF